MRRGVRAALAALAALAAVGGVDPSAPATAAQAIASPAAGERVEFVLLGDVPYNTLEEHSLRQVLAASGDARFVLHVGDVKSGWEGCDDALLTRRRDLLEGATRAPLVFVPGDNDWSDCERAVAGGFEPFERLETVRRLFFPRAATLGPRSFAVERQSDQPGEPWRENQRWRIADVPFVTLNRPGGVELDKQPPAAAAEFRRLAAANERWLRAAFEQARATRAPLLVIASHADPMFGMDEGGLRFARRDLHRAFRDLLRELCAGYAGTVLFVHGDTHRFRHDQPLLGRDGEPVRNFWRVESYGSPFAASWVRIAITPGKAPGFSVEAFQLERPKPP